MEARKLICERKNQTFLYASFPEICNLCCAICEIDFIEVQDSTKSNFHWQTLKCRLLIHLISDVIASPVSGTDKYICIIAPKMFFELGKLEKILRNFRLVYQGLRSITPELYKTCLKYTLQTKVAPLWNSVGDYYIHGKEFYNAVGACDALTLDIIVNERDMSLQLHTEKVKVSYIKLEDYLPSSVISHFLADPKGYIDLSKYNFPFVHVLPSIKKGKLLSVSKEIPSRSTFKDYNQLRRHWKNMYGYSLPKNSDGILYYEIKFLIAKSNIFTYPNLCVMSGPLDIIFNKDKESTITHFLSDMVVKVPTICGKQLQISKSSPYNTNLLHDNSSLNTLPKDKELNTHLEEIDNTKKQFTYERTKGTNIALQSLKRQLAAIHEIHNVQFGENICSRQNQNENRESVFNKNNITREPNDHFAVTEGRTISKYFKMQKPHPPLKKGEPQQEKIETRLTLKEKLSNAKSVEGYGIPLHKMDQKTNVEAVAKNDSLDEINSIALSDQIDKHSTPHDPKRKKGEHVCNASSHIKNFQVLQHFRM